MAHLDTESGTEEESNTSTMKIAVTSQNRNSITAHAGRCLNFWVYQVQDDKVMGKSLVELAREQSFFETAPLDPHPLDDVDVFITAGMGEGLLRRLRSKGTRSYITSVADPDEAVTRFLDGTLKARTFIRS